MNTWKLRSFCKVSLVVGLSTFVLIAEGATAVATVTANIVPPANQRFGLTISTSELNMFEKRNDEITIQNRSGDWKALQVDLSPVSGSREACHLRYSPMTFSIPPGGQQVVRIMMLNRNNNPQHRSHQLEISEMTLSGARIFSVPVETLPESIRRMGLRPERD